MISIIVPIYNVENYLKQCINSILEQTYSDFEIILVDDGSTDKSGLLCDEFSIKDDRIRVIHKTNGGLSDARNVGTEAAKGSYITYIDSDDYVSLDYLESLIKPIQKYGVSISVTGIERFFDGEMPYENRIEQESVFIYSGKEALEMVLYQKGMDTSACALLVDRQIALKYKFPYKKYHEDDYTTYKYYLNSKKVARVSKKQYFYRQRRGSIMHTFGQASEDELDAADNLVNQLSEIDKDLERAAKSKKYSDYCQVLLSSDDIENKNPDVYTRICSYLNSEKWHMLFNKKARFKNRTAALLAIIGIRFLKLVNKLSKMR